LLLLLPPSSAFAVNTYSADFEAASTQYFSIDDASQTGLDLTGDWAWECWYRFESLPADTEYTAIAEKWVGGERQYGFAITNDTGTYKFYYVDSAAGAGDVKSGSVAFTTLAVDTWYHIGLSRDASAASVSVFIGDEDTDEHTLVGTISSLNTSTFNGTNPLYFGYGPANFTNYFDGLQDDCRVYDTTKTIDDFNGTMNEELVGNESGLIAYWKFENDALDTTANNNDLTNNNSVAFVTIVPDWTVGGGGGGSTTTTATTTFPLTYSETLFMYQVIVFLLALASIGLIFSPFKIRKSRIKPYVI
jgi:hypothetical protein